MSEDEGPGSTGQDSGDAAALDALEAELRASAARLDPPHPGVLAAARAAFGMRALDAELAVLLLDSWDRHPDPARPLATVRSAEDLRLLSFDLHAATLDAEVTRRPYGPEVVGHVGPQQPGVLELETPHGRTSVEADALGRFIVRVATGPLRFRADFGDRVVVTPWVTV